MSCMCIAATCVLKMPLNPNHPSIVCVNVCKIFHVYSTYIADVFIECQSETIICKLDNGARRQEGVLCAIFGLAVKKSEKFH